MVSTRVLAACTSALRMLFLRQEPMEWRYGALGGYQGTSRNGAVEKGVSATESSGSALRELREAEAVNRNGKYVANGVVGSDS